MIEMINDGDEGIIAIRVGGKVTAADYQGVLIPALDRALEAGKRARFLVIFDQTFSGWTLGAAWDDAAYWFQHRRQFEKVAIVGGPSWVGWSVNAMRPFLYGEFRMFEASQAAEALSWLKDSAQAA